MKLYCIVAVAVWLVVVPIDGRSQVTSPSSNDSPITVLNDTQGVDFGQYLNQQVLPKIRKNWYDLIPEEARAPLMKQGKVSIEFHILKEGYLQDLKYASSSGDAALDRAAWWAVEDSKPFPPLPSEFHGPYLAIRFNFFYNPSPGEVAKMKQPPISQVHKENDISARPGELASATDNSIPPVILDRPEPKFPKHYKAAANDAIVQLSLLVDKRGKAKDFRVMKSMGNELDNKAIEQVKKHWVFKAALKDGAPVAAALNVEVRFR